MDFVSWILVVCIVLLLSLLIQKYVTGNETLVENQEKRQNAQKRQETRDDANVVPVLGKWQFQSSENFDEFLVALGCNFGLRQLAKCSMPTEIIEPLADGQGYSIQNITPLKKLRMDFVIGNEFDNKEADGRQVRVTVTVEKDVLVETQRCPQSGQVTVVIKRRLENQNLMITVSQTVILPIILK